jgi:hypothetical protein
MGLNDSASLQSFFETNRDEHLPWKTSSSARLVFQVKSSGSIHDAKQSYRMPQRQAKENLTSNEEIQFACRLMEHGEKQYDQGDVPVTPKTLLIQQPAGEPENFLAGSVRRSLCQLAQIDLFLLSCRQGRQRHQDCKMDWRA